MTVETRLRKLEKIVNIQDRAPMRILVHFVDPDPAIGVVSMLAMSAGMERRDFIREPGESVEQMCARVRAVLGWSDDNDYDPDRISRGAVI